MKRKPIRVEPFATYLEGARDRSIGHRCRRARLRVRPAAIRPGNRRDQAIALRAPTEIRARADEALPGGCGPSMERVVKLNVYCTAEATHFAKFNEAYARYFAIEIPGTDLPVCSFLAGTVRYRDRLRRSRHKSTRGLST